MKAIISAQTKLLKTFARCHPCTFALAGGTALERFYIHHRLSRDIDLFSPTFDRGEVERIVRHLRRGAGLRIAKTQESIAPHHARVLTYSATVPRASRRLKIDFVEDVLIPGPSIRIIDHVPVYSARDIYFHKIVAIAGVAANEDSAGRAVPTGRNEPRDAFDIYMLSRCVEPLHKFLNTVPRMYQRRFVRWARTYSRVDMKIGLLELDIRVKDFDSREMIAHIDNEVRAFVRRLT